MIKVRVYRKNSDVPETIEKQVPHDSDYEKGELTFLETSIVVFHKEGIYIRPLFKNKEGVLQLKYAKNITLTGQNGGVTINPKPIFNFTF